MEGLLTLAMLLLYYFAMIIKHQQSDQSMEMRAVIESPLFSIGQESESIGAVSESASDRFGQRGSS